MLCELSLCFHICLHVRGKEGKEQAELPHRQGHGVGMPGATAASPETFLEQLLCASPAPSPRPWEKKGLSWEEGRANRRTVQSQGTLFCPSQETETPRPDGDWPPQPRDSPAEPFFCSGTAENQRRRPSLAVLWLVGEGAGGESQPKQDSPSPGGPILL